MDPNACYLSLRASVRDNDAESALEYHDALSTWNAAGGFLPSSCATMSRRRFIGHINELLREAVTDRVDTLLREVQS